MHDIAVRRGIIIDRTRFHHLADRHGGSLSGMTCRCDWARGCDLQVDGRWRINIGLDDDDLDRQLP